MNWNEVIALFGGTFDPPHIGHLEAVRGLFKNPGIRKVKIIPAASPPHKPSVATTEQRLEMTQLNFTSLHENFEIDLREIERSRRNPGFPSYSFDTIQDLSREIPATHLAFVIGADQLDVFETWHRFPEILGLCHWIILERKSSPSAENKLNQWESSGLVLRKGNLWAVKSTQFNLRITPTDAPAMSSTQIRQSIAKTGEPLPGTLSKEVFAYLKRNRLYGTTSP